MPHMAGKLKKGETMRFSNNGMQALKWMNKREVQMLSTCHSAEMTKTEKIDRTTKEVVEKPLCVLEYNKSAVDRTDMLQISIESVRKSIKWYKKVFLHLTDISLLNAHAIYKTKHVHPIFLLQTFSSNWLNKCWKNTIRCHHQEPVVIGVLMGTHRYV